MKLREVMDLAAQFDQYRPQCQTYTRYEYPDGSVLRLSIGEGEDNKHTVKSAADVPEAHEWLRKRGVKRAQPAVAQ